MTTPSLDAVVEKYGERRAEMELKTEAVIKARFAASQSTNMFDLIGDLLPGCKITPVGINFSIEYKGKTLGMLHGNEAFTHHYLLKWVITNLNSLCLFEEELTPKVVSATFEELTALFV